MRRSYEFKQERHVVHETRGWNYPSYEENRLVSSPSNYKMLEKPSFHYDPSDHHEDEMGFHGSHRNIHHDDGSNGWYGTRHLNNNSVVKKNEHHAMGAKTILRPPLGSLKPPPSHQDHGHHKMFNGRQVVDNQNRWDYGGDAYDGYTRRSPQTSSFIAQKNRMEGSKSTLGEVAKFEDYEDDDDDGEVGGKFESLIKGLMHRGPRGPAEGSVRKIEVIQYERTYNSGGGVAAQQQWKVLGGRSASSNDNNNNSHYMASYPNDAPWVKGF